MLRIGLSGGIGAGKSTVSSTFGDLGGVVVDGDVISREVVEPGTEGLAKLVEAFGEDILSDDGSLNRPALAAIAFSDDEKRQTLNGIVHPLVADRRSELIAAAGDDAVIVEDIPLLVESGMAPMFPLVVIVNAEEDLRVKRLIEHAGSPRRTPGPGSQLRPPRNSVARSPMSGSTTPAAHRSGRTGAHAVETAHPAVRAQISTAVSRPA